MTALTTPPRLSRLISLTALITLSAAVLLAGCTPTVQLAAPTEPIEFNVNINITQEVRIRIDQELQEAFRANPELFGLSRSPQAAPVTE